METEIKTKCFIQKSTIISLQDDRDAKFQPIKKVSFSSINHHLYVLWPLKNL